MDSDEDDERMFLIECSRCHRRSIAGYAQLVALAHSSTGPVALVRCRCGEPTAVEYGARTAVASAARS